MKYTAHIVSLCAAAFMMSAMSCKDDISETLRSEAIIEPYSFIVTGTGLQNPEKEAPVFRTTFSEDGHAITIRVPENIDPAVELNGATVKFFISMGATVSPLMTEPQDFSDPDNPVVYTVTAADGSHSEQFTVSYTIIPPTCVAAGEGFTGSELVACKTYSELGFPGTYHPWAQNGTIWGGSGINAEWGDIIGMPAFCGTDRLVIFARRYAWGDNGASGSGNAMAANPAQAFKVFSLPDMQPAGQLNLGSIDVSQVVFVTSDWKGHMVAAVGRITAGKTDFYYWTTPDEAPHHVGTAPVSIEIGSNDTDAGSYINIAGDITGAAVIAASAPRDAEGTHYKFRVAGGDLLTEYQTVKTGHSALDKNSFQMISFFGTSESAPYLVGDTEANGSEDNGQIRVYLNNANGTNRGTMDYHDIAINGWAHDDGEVWWSRSGQWLDLDGARRPTVHALVLNGKPYSYFSTGTAGRNRGVLMDQDLQAAIDTYPHFGFGNTIRAKDTRPATDGGIWIRTSFGCMVDWYFDDETQEGYIAFWSDRFGIHLFDITCREL